MEKTVNLEYSGNNKSKKNLSLMVILNCDYNCIESDIVSIRRFGRIKIPGVTRKT